MATDCNYDMNLVNNIGNDLVSAFNDGYAHGKADAKPKWIPVTERLPEYDKVVQITDGIEVGHGYLEGIDTTMGVTSFWHSPFCDIDETRITHWMPLPQPPEESGGK